MSKEILLKVNFSFKLYYNARKGIDEWLGRGLQNFPDSEQLHTLVSRRNKEFNMTWPDYPTSDYNHCETLFNNSMAPVAHGRENTPKNEEKQFNDVQTDSDALNDIVFSTPFTQILNVEFFDKMEESAIATCSKRLNNAAFTPTGVENVVPLSIVPPRRTKRIIQLTDKFRSPYFNRVVDPNARLNRQVVSFVMPSSSLPLYAVALPFCSFNFFY